MWTAQAQVVEGIEGVVLKVTRDNAHPGGQWKPPASPDESEERHVTAEAVNIEFLTEYTQFVNELNVRHSAHDEFNRNTSSLVRAKFTLITGYSEHAGKVKGKYSTGPGKEGEPPDWSATGSDEIVVKIIKLDMVPNTIDTSHPRYLGLSRWKTTPETSRPEYACGDKGADIAIECLPKNHPALSLKLVLDVNGDKIVLHEGNCPGGENVVELQNKIEGKIGKYKLSAKWGDVTDEREDYWFLGKEEYDLTAKGMVFNLQQFLAEYTDFARITKFLRGIDVIPTSITRLEPDKWGLKLQHAKGLGHKIWCEHDCPEHKHEGDNCRLCEHAYPWHSHHGNQNIAYEKEADASILLAEALIKATPLGKIPAIPGIDISGMMAEYIASELKKLSGINMQGKVSVGGKVDIDRHEKLLYYPCYRFEPFLGDNQDNKWITGRFKIAPEAKLRGGVSMMRFWNKRINGKPLEEWYVEACHAARIDAYVPLFIQVRIELSPTYEWRGSGIYSQTVVDENGRPLRLLDNHRKDSITGQIGAIIHYNQRLYSFANKQNRPFFRVIDYFSYAYVSRDGIVESSVWEHIPRNEVKPNIPKLNMVIADQTVIYANEKKD